jgi:hypothetical protein
MWLTLSRYGGGGASPGRVEETWSRVFVVWSGHIPPMPALLAGVGDDASAAGDAHGTRPGRPVADRAGWVDGGQTRGLVHVGLGLGRGFVGSQTALWSFQCHQREATGGPAVSVLQRSHAGNLYRTLGQVTVGFLTMRWPAAGCARAVQGGPGARTHASSTGGVGKCAGDRPIRNHSAGSCEGIQLMAYGRTG